MKNIIIAVLVVLTTAGSIQLYRLNNQVSYLIERLHSERENHRNTIAHAQTDHEDLVRCENYVKEERKSK